MATLQIYAKAHGTTGKIDVDVVASDSMPAKLYYAHDSYNPKDSINWVEGPSLTAPGSIELDTSISGWYLIQVVGIYEGETVVSNVSKVHPNQYGEGFSVDIIRRSVLPYNYKDLQAYRLRIDAVNGVNMSAGIFLYEKVPTGELTEEMRDNFVAVCKPGDLFTYPVNNPRAGQVPPFFRLASIDLLDENIEKLEELADAIEYDIRELVSSLQKNIELRVEDAYTVYGRPGASSSSSSYSSSSYSSSSSSSNSSTSSSSLSLSSSSSSSLSSSSSSSS